MKTRIHYFMFFGLLVLGVPGRAVTVATAPAGCVRLEASGGRDSWLSLPLVRRSEFMGRVAAVEPTTLSLGNGSLSANAYAPTNTESYYLQFVTGDLAGLSYKIVGNTADEVTLATLGDDLSAHELGAVRAGATGDLVRIRPYWTVAGIFGRESGLLLDPVSALSTAIYTESDALLFPDNRTIGTEKAPASIVVYVAGQGWRKQGQPVTESGGTEFSSGVPFILRRQNGAALSTLVVGYVAQEPRLIRLPALSAGGTTDVAVALCHPVLKPMAGSGLSAVMESSVDADRARDLLLSPADIRNGFSIPPARRLHLVGSAWFEGETPADDQTLRYGTGFVLRLRGERPVRYWRQVMPN